MQRAEETNKQTKKNEYITFYPQISISEFTIWMLILHSNCYKTLKKNGLDSKINIFPIYRDLMHGASVPFLQTNFNCKTLQHPPGLSISLSYTKQ